MKQQARSDATRASKTPQPSRPARPASAERFGGALSQLAGMINGGPQAQAMTQLKEAARQGPQVQRLAGLAAEINQGAATPAGPECAAPGPVIQRYEVKQAPEDHKIYSRSGNGNMITGMGSPNHDFFVAHNEAFPVMNELIKDSPLELFARSRKTLFANSMFQVGLRYKTSRLTDEARKEQIRQKSVKKKFFEPEEKGNLQLQYEKHVLPNIKLYRENIAHETLEKINRLGIDPSTIKAIRTRLYDLMGSLNLFKKVFTAELANRGEFDQESEELAGVSLGLIQTVEGPLYKTDLTRTDLAQARQTLLETWFDEEDRDNPNLISKIVYAIRDNLEALIAAFPEDRPVNMFLFQKYNFNLEIIQKLYDRDNLVLYRACDVQASTLLGNKVTEENAQQLKNYSAGGGAFHYATKILGSGADWVTLEHFAASELERKISGTERAKFKNLDHTWQFIMQGVQPSVKKGISNEDKYFEIYTKIRYYLKGLVQHQQGEFDTARRDRLERPEVERFVQLSESSQLSNVMGWRAFYDRISDENEEQRLIDVLSRIEGIALIEKKDPLVFAKESWDDLMALMKK